MKEMKKVLAVGLSLAMAVTAAPATYAEAAVTTPKLSASSATLYVGYNKAQSKTLTLKTPSTWKSVKTTVSSNKKSVATVKKNSTKKFTVKAVKASGTPVVISVKITGKKSGKSVSKTLKTKVTVKKAVVKFKNAEGTAITSYSALVGQELPVTAKSAPSSSAITLTSNKEDVVKIQDGKMIAVGAGEATILAKNTYGETASLTVRVNGETSVKNVEVLNGVQLKVTFNQPVYTALNASNLTLKDAKGAAVAYTGSWVDEKNKTEYILDTAPAVMKGQYTVALAAKAVQNNFGSYFEAYEKTVDVADTTAPTVVGTEYNDACDTVYIKFSEPMLGNGTISASRADGVALKDSIALVARPDVYTYAVKLTKAGSTFVDGNKDINLSLTGIVDYAGNVPGNGGVVNVVANYDVAPVANASIVSIVRTGLKEVTIQFSSKIETAGTISVAGKTAIPGTVDAADKTKVKYVLPAAEQALTGSQLVTVAGFKAYKAEKAADATIKTADFSYTKVAAPVLTKLTYVPASATNAEAYFLASYDKEVVINDLAIGSTTVTSKLVDGTIKTDTVAMKSNKKATNDATATTDIASKIVLTTMPTVSGTYTIKLPAGIAKNKDGVANAEQTVTVDVVVSTVATALPAPAKEKVVQSTTDTSVITLTFDKKLDVTSAENVSNYSVAGATVKAASLTANSDNGAVVSLKVEVPQTRDYAVVVKGVKGYNDSYTAMESTTYIMNLKDTVAPMISGAEVTQIGNSVSSNSLIKVTFSESVTLAKSTSNALELVVGSAKYMLTNADAINSNTAVFTITTVDGKAVTTTQIQEIVNGGIVQVVANGTKIVDNTGSNSVSNSFSVSNK